MTRAAAKNQPFLQKNAGFSRRPLFLNLSLKLALLYGNIGNQPVTAGLKWLSQKFFFNFTPFCTY